MTAEHYEKPLILVVDDEPDIRELIQDILQDEGYQVIIAGNGEQARAAFSMHNPALILLDIWMPDIDGISLLKEFKQQNNPVTIIMMSGHGTIETAVEATRLGAHDFIEKPLSMAKLVKGIEVAIESQKKQLARLQQYSQEPIGKSVIITQLKAQVKRVAKHSMPILLLGEEGSGKHCFAHYLHSQGNFSQGKFIEISADSFPDDSAKLQTLAQNSCLFIHDVAQLPEAAQTLLDYLLDTEKLSSCQLIFSSQYSLETVVLNGKFKESLLYKINSITLSIPALRDHIEDIPDLVQHFVVQQTSQAQVPYRHFTVAAQNRLRNYSWPGNVLELKNIIQRLLLLGEKEEIDIDDINNVLPTKKTVEENIQQHRINFNLPLREAREQFERLYLIHKLNETGGNVGQAARLAGMERTHLYRKLRTLGIDAKQI